MAPKKRLKTHKNTEKGKGNNIFLCVFNPFLGVIQLDL
jgi:hypothetical protein